MDFTQLEDILDLGDNIVKEMSVIVYESIKATEPRNLAQNHNWRVSVAVKIGISENLKNF